MKKTISLLMILCMIITCAMSAGYTASAQDIGYAEAAAAGDDYGLGETCKDGNILHCFNWTLSQIKQELPNIAQAGFTSVQTSPLQGHDGNNQWYWLYQPTNFNVGNELGSYSDLQLLCTEAHKYGIKVIVDVVANHVAGSNSGTIANAVDSSLKKGDYYHKEGACNDWDNRHDITHKNIGMPDLKSEHTDIQNFVANYVSQLQEAGVDGIRWDAAKHIGLPSEDCAFWSTMAQFDLYQYGEILGNPAGNSGDAVNKALINEYAQYVGVTDSEYSSNIMSAVMNGTTYKQPGYWTKKDVSADKIVLWGESHDTYANDTDDGGWTKNLDQNTIDRAYAIVGAREGSQALYLSRPSEKNKTSIYYGKKGSTHFTSKEVAAVNHFHNAMAGTEEKYSSTNGCFVVWRSYGAVIVSMDDEDVDISISNNSSMVAEGTYTDEISGNTFTVTGSKITGHIGSSGIAVFYDADPDDFYLAGDVDGNGYIEIIDATIVQRYNASFNISYTDEEVNLRGDVDFSGSADILDVTMIRRYLVELATSSSHVGERVKPV